MKPSELLRKARKLIERPEWWIKGQMSRHLSGESHICYCSFGAVNHAAFLELDAWPFAEAWRALNAQVGARGFIEWQDRPETTHAEVLEKFDKAIIVLELQHQ